MLIVAPPIARDGIQDGIDRQQGAFCGANGCAYAASGCGIVGTWWYQAQPGIEFLNRVPGFDSRRGYHRFKASECGAPIIDDRRSVLLTAKLTAKVRCPHQSTASGGGSSSDASRSSSIFVVASRCRRGRTCAYVFIVVLIWLWRRISIITRG